MCTALAFHAKDNYFGRNLDFDFDFNQEVVITPRKFKFIFKQEEKTIAQHPAIIGMGIVVENYPLYFDATNEKGLSMAGLYFSGNAVYQKAMPNKNNIATYELIPWVLTQCTTIAEVKNLLKDINITDQAFNTDYPPSPLHWFISDKNKSIVLESVEDGIKIYDNPTDVLTNNPPFPMQLFHLNQYRHCSSKISNNFFAKDIPLVEYSRGMGAIGIPGDLTSTSRFARVAFIRANAFNNQKTEEEAINQFFHILKSVEQQKGLCDIGGGAYEYTIYSSCCNADKGIYYYTTYQNSQISAVSMHNENLDSTTLITYPLVIQENIYYINAKKKQ